MHVERRWPIAGRESKEGLPEMERMKQRWRWNQILLVPVVMRTLVIITTITTAMCTVSPSRTVPVTVPETGWRN